MHEKVHEIFKMDIAAAFQELFCKVNERTLYLYPIRAVLECSESGNVRSAACFVASSYGPYDEN